MRIDTTKLAELQQRQRFGGLTLAEWLAEQRAEDDFRSSVPAPPKRYATGQDHEDECEIGGEG